MKTTKLLCLLGLSAMLTLHLSSCKDNEDEVQKEPEPITETDLTSANMADYLKSQTSGSTVTVALTDANPDFAKIRAALTENESVKVKLDLAKCTDLKEIPSNAFYNGGSIKKSTEAKGMKNLVAIILPETIVKIGKNAFRDCILLTEINLPEKVEVIESYVFANCESLKLIVIPKSVIEIGENVFEGCTQIEITNNSNVSLDNKQEENFDILPKKITKIVGHWTEDRVNDKGDTHYFIYDFKGRIQYLIEEPTQPSEYSERTTYTYTYTDNLITKNNKDNQIKFTLQNGLVSSYSKEYSHSKWKNLCSFNYTDGFCQTQSETDEDGYQSTYQYTINDGIYTEFLSGNDKCTYEYSNVKNNLNVDLFTQILDPWNNAGHYLGEYFGKRNKYLPSKITDNLLSTEGHIYDYTIAYEFDGDYITKIEIICNRDDGNFQYDEWYEISYDAIDITPEPEEYVEYKEETISITDIKAVVDSKGYVTITAIINSNAVIKTLELNDNEGRTKVDLLHDGDMDRIKAIKEAGESGNQYTLEIPQFSFPIEDALDGGLSLKYVTQGGKSRGIPLTERLISSVAPAKGILGSFWDVSSNKTYRLSEAKSSKIDVMSVSSEDGLSITGFKKASKASNAEVAANASKVALLQNSEWVDEISEGGIIITENGAICKIIKITNSASGDSQTETIMMKSGSELTVDVSNISSNMSK